MSLNWARPGLGAVGEYQASGTPLVLSAGTHSLKFYSRAIVVLPGGTHVLVEHHADQGYLLAFPVDTDQDKIMEIIKQ